MNNCPHQKDHKCTLETIEDTTAFSEMLEIINTNKLATKKITEEAKQAEETFGTRLSDKVATFGGSWKFIIVFFSIMLTWMLLNTILSIYSYHFLKAFDVYPFIFLNLMLSCLAAIQAPIIMMSQNRQEARDRVQAENAYKVGMLTEIGLRLVDNKLDKLFLVIADQLIDLNDKMDKTNADTSFLEERK